MGAGVPKVTMPALPGQSPDFSDDAVQRALMMQLRRSGAGLGSTFKTTAAGPTGTGVPGVFTGALGGNG